MDAFEFGIEERTLEVDAEAARTDAFAHLFELVRGFGNFACRVHHRFPRRGHDPGDEAGGAHARIGA